MAYVSSGIPLMRVVKVLLKVLHNPVIPNVHQVYSNWLLVLAFGYPSDLCQLLKYFAPAVI